MNTLFASKINQFNLENVVFVDPLDAIEESCIADIHSYYECFIDSDHLSKESARKIINHLYEKQLK